jgi:hypothetical protein
VVRSVWNDLCGGARSTEPPRTTDEYRFSDAPQLNSRMAWKLPAGYCKRATPMTTVAHKLGCKLSTGLASRRRRYPLDCLLGIIATQDRSCANRRPISPVWVLTCVSISGPLLPFGGTPFGHLHPTQCSDLSPWESCTWRQSPSLELIVASTIG